MANLFVSPIDSLESNINRVLKENNQILWINNVNQMFYIYSATHLNRARVKEELIMNFPDRKEEINLFSLDEFLEKISKQQNKEEKEKSKEEIEEELNTIKNLMKNKANVNNFVLTENFEKIAKAKYNFFAKKGLNPLKCPCDADNEERYCISETCLKDIFKNGKCHCGCYSLEKPSCLVEEEKKEENANEIVVEQKVKEEAKQEEAVVVPSITSLPTTVEEEKIENDVVEEKVEEKAKITGTKNYPEKGMYKMNISFKEYRGKVEITDDEVFFVLNNFSVKTKSKKGLEENKVFVKENLTKMCQKAEEKIKNMA